MYTCMCVSDNVLNSRPIAKILENYLLNMVFICTKLKGRKKNGLRKGVKYDRNFKIEFSCTNKGKISQNEVPKRSTTR